MRKLLNIAQVSELFGNLPENKIRQAIDSGEIILPESHSIAGDDMWWSDDVRRALRLKFRKAYPPVWEGSDALSDAIAKGVYGCRNGWVSKNAVNITAGSVHSKTLSDYMISKGYICSFRANTTPAERDAFSSAGPKTHIYHKENLIGGPAHLMSLYESAQQDVVMPSPSIIRDV